MRVSGFTFVRNGIIYDYPFLESIKSLLPLVDEMIINVPSSDDNTLEVVKSVRDSKIKIITSDWDGIIPSKGRILSHHTNLALNECSGDWCFYIQGDEVLSELDYEIIRNELNSAYHNKKVDGLIFNYHHFYGSFDCVARARNWYRREVRVIRNNRNIVSFEDAQGFRFSNGKKINAKLINANIFHYGWVRPIEIMRIKKKAMDRLWHGSQMDDENQEMNYSESRYGLKKFSGKHPLIMEERIKKADWTFNYRSGIASLKDFRYWLSDFFEKLTGIRFFEYKGYRQVK